MWIISILSESVIHTIFGLGVLLTLLGFILPVITGINSYKLLLQIFSVILLIFGVYIEGGLADYKEWQLKVSAMQLKLVKLEAESANVNAEIQERVVEKTKVVRERGQTIIKYLDRDVIKKEEVVQFIENCPLPKEIIDIHNVATELKEMP